MNKGIDVQLCSALRHSGLWSDGVAVSHAKRYFTPGEIAVIAQDVSEPLRTNAISDACATALADIGDPGAALDMVRCALVYKGELRAKIVRSAVFALRRHLQPGGSWILRSQTFNLNRLKLLRALLKLQSDCADDDLQSWSLDSYFDSLVAESRLWSPDPKIFYDSTYFKNEFNEVMIGLETLLYVAFRGVGTIRSDAVKLVVAIYKMIHNRKDYAPISFKIAVLLGIENNIDVLREKGLSALESSLFSKIDLGQNLWEYDGFMGLAKLIFERLGEDRIFHKLLLESEIFNSCRAAFFEIYVVEEFERVGDIVTTPPTNDRLKELVRRLIVRGSVISGASVSVWVKINPDDLILIRGLARSGILTKYMNQSLLIDDLSRVLNDVDRIKVLEAILPCVSTVSGDDAEALCNTFSHNESKGRARLLLGSRVPAEKQSYFLEEAISALAESGSSIEALRALSDCYGSYSGEHLRAVARAAVSFAEGIGDADLLKRAYANASLASRYQTRREHLQAGFWYKSDTLPKHDQIAPLPRGRALVQVPFWSEHPLSATSDTMELRQSADSTKPDATFLSAVINHLRSFKKQRTRAQLYDECTDIALECYLRGLHSHSNIIAEAMFDSALMYR